MNDGNILTLLLQFKIYKLNIMCLILFAVRESLDFSFDKKKKDTKQPHNPCLLCMSFYFVISFATI